MPNMREWGILTSGEETPFFKAVEMNDLCSSGLLLRNLN